MTPDDVVPATNPAEALFLESLETVERVVTSVCRRHGLMGDDADDFRSWVNLKLVESDYAVFTKFRGRSSLESYLAVVVSNLFRDYRIHRWGRWRPSARAVQLGPLAVCLETLISRDGHTAAEAIEVIRHRGDVRCTERELLELADRLPPRVRLRPVRVPVADLPSGTDPDGELARRERMRARRELENALHSALERLPPEDRTILRMRFWDGLTVAEVARTLGLPQRPLYRRIERRLADLGRALREAGVTGDAVGALLEGEAAD